MSQLATETSSTWKYLGHNVYCLRSPLKDSSLNESLKENPAILLIHGFGASTDHWRYNIPKLSLSHEVHAFDLLGFGRSSKPGELKYGGPLWRDQVVSYVNEIIQRPTVLVGNSLGGYAALAAGSALGKDSAGVVLLNAAGRFSEEKQSKQGFMNKAIQFIGGGFLKDPLIQRLIFENLRRPGTIRRTLNQVYIDKTNVDDQLVEAIRKPSCDPGAFEVFRSVFEPGGPPGKPLDELFAELKSPLLLLWGNQDPWMNTPSKRAIFQKYTPQNTTEIVLEAGHCPHDEVPEKVNKALLDWLEKIN
tara:strand:+ start:12636 stop:13547 length:912 start_codon:yes stop_codon:yes gene_type:complete